MIITYLLTYLLNYFSISELIVAALCVLQAAEPHV